MFIKSLFFLLSTLPLLNAITAELILVEYEPLVFELRFSENVYRTSFQLLYNNLYNITYTYETESTFSSLYRLQADTSRIQKTTTLQSYNLLFNNPLSVGNGNLDISSYSITAKKSDIMINFPTSIGILLVLSGYFFNSISGIGKLIIEFMQIYILVIFSSRMTSTIKQQLYECLMLIPPENILVEQIGDYDTFMLCCLIIPFFLVVIFGVVGSLYKRFSTSIEQKSFLKNIIYQELVFNSLIKSTRLFWFNMFYNSLMFIRIAADKTLRLQESTVQVGYIFVYFNILTCLALLYLKFFILNPIITKRTENIQKYYKGKQFNSFRMLHQRVFLQPWYKRNYDIFQSLKMFIIVGIFFGSNVFQYFALLFQFMHVFFIFTVRPLVEEFYQNAKVIINLLMFTEFLLIVLGNLYFSIGEAIFNYYSASKYIVARDTLFLLIQLFIIGVVFWQIYFKCSNLSYQVKLVKQAESYKLQFIAKNKQDAATKDRKYTATAYSEPYSKSQEKRGISLSQVTSPKKKRDSTKSNLKVSDKLKSSLSKRKSRIQLDLQLEDIKKDIQKEICRQKSKSIKDSQKQLPRKRKWKQESLLQGIVKTK